MLAPGCFDYSYSTVGLEFWYCDTFSFVFLFIIILSYLGFLRFPYLFPYIYLFCYDKNAIGILVEITHNLKITFGSMDIYNVEILLIILCCISFEYLGCLFCSCFLHFYVYFWHLWKLMLVYFCKVLSLNQVSDLTVCFFSGHSNVCGG